MTQGSGSPCPAVSGLVAQPDPWVRLLGHRGTAGTSLPGDISSIVFPMWCQVPTLPVLSIRPCLPRCQSLPGCAVVPRPPRRGGARHLGLSGGSCEMSANILCGLLRQASRCRCWRASGNRSLAVTNGSGAAAVPTRAPPQGWVVPRHPRLHRWDPGRGSRWAAMPAAAGVG